MSSMLRRAFTRVAAELARQYPCADDAAQRAMILLLP